MEDDAAMMSNQDRLIYMANQIARNLDAMADGVAVEAVADHIASFWAPRMRAQIFALQAEGRAKLTPVADAAVTLLRSRDKAAAARPGQVAEQPGAQ